MKIIQGQKNMTISAGEEIYNVLYSSIGRIAISNNTDSNIYINDSGDFTKKNGVGGYITLPAGSSCSDYKADRLYIKSEGTGNIVIGRG